MSATNYISTTVKILEEPKKKESRTSILVTEVRAQVSEVRSKPSKVLVTLQFWGNLGQAVLHYYRPNDYLIIEGYISLKRKTILRADPQISKHIEITVFKVYPLVLKSI